MENKTDIHLTPTIRLTLTSYAIALITIGTVSNSLLLFTIIFRYKRRRVFMTRMKSLAEELKRPPSATHLKQVNKSLTLADELLVLLTICDLFCLWILVLRHTVLLLTSYDIRIHSQLLCKIHTYASMVCSNLSTALLCIFSVQRTICIKWPLVSYTWFSRSRLNICLFVSLLLILLKHAPVFYFFNIYQKGNDYYCDFALEDAHYFTIYYEFEFITHVIIGYLLLAVANVCLCVFLRDKRPNHSSSGSSSTSCTCTQRSLRKGGHNTGRIVLLFSTFQLITSVPFFVLIELNQVFGMRLFPARYAITVFYFTILAVLTNNALNYFLLLAISKRFREDSAEFLVNVFSYIRVRCAP
ncbi:unnamed protein product [Calicophoron daubneyi]|uniref:G-protein coupled receptors family 1 profile domain-containing protein n=1 Tax=Calicophoron daubneyi TaxID=300641 RepID=A0AAV2TP43_CALDB